VFHRRQLRRPTQLSQFKWKKIRRSNVDLTI
jgi:hypothetical protein